MTFPSGSTLVFVLGFPSVRSNTGLKFWSWVGGPIPQLGNSYNSTEYLLTGNYNNYYLLSLNYSQETLLDILYLFSIFLVSLKIFLQKREQETKSSSLK